MKEKRKEKKDNFPKSWRLVPIPKDTSKFSQSSLIYLSLYNCHTANGSIIAFKYFQPQIHLLSSFSTRIVPATWPSQDCLEANLAGWWSKDA